MTTPHGFNDRVLAWLRSYGGRPEAASIADVTGFGTDDAGDTDHGFYPTFSVRITWCDDAGTKHTRAVEGADMAYLWNWVVTASEFTPVPDKAGEKK